VNSLLARARCLDAADHVDRAAEDRTAVLQIVDNLDASSRNECTTACGADGLEDLQRAVMISIGGSLRPSPLRLRARQYFAAHPAPRTVNTLADAREYVTRAQNAFATGQGAAVTADLAQRALEGDVLLKQGSPLDVIRPLLMMCRCEMFAWVLGELPKIVTVTRARLPGCEACALALTSHALLQTGAVAEALVAAKEAADLSRTESSYAHALAHSFYADALLVDGRVDEALDEVQPWSEATVRGAPSKWLPQMVTARALLAAYRDQDALKLLDDLSRDQEERYPGGVEGIDPSHACPALRPSRSERALALARAGLIQDGLDAAEGELLSATQWGHPV